jgi:hypothetical protein
VSRIVTVQSNFTTGEIDPKIKSRVDLQQYYNGLDVAQNVTIQPQGGIQRRNGSEFVADLETQLEESIDLMEFNDAIQLTGVSGTEFVSDTGIFIKPDGTEIYAVGQSSNAEKFTYQFSTNTAWDFTDLSYAGKNSTSLGYRGITFNNNGTKIFQAGDNGGNNRIASATLTTAWDITTMGSPGYATPTYDGHTSFTAFDISFNDDGTKVFLLIQDTTSGSSPSSSEGDDDLLLVQYNLSSAYSFAGATQSHEINVGERQDDRLFFSFADSGSKVYVGERVYVLSTAYDLSTASRNDGSSAFSDAPEVDYSFYVRDDESAYYYISWSGAFGGSNRLNVVSASATPKFKMVPFEFSVDDSYMLVLSQQRMYVFKNGAQVTNINGSGDNYLEILPLYTQYVDSLNFTQAADSLILTHPDMPPQFIQRGATDSSWTVEDLVFDFVPKYAYTLNIDEPNFTITPSDVTGNITITASAVTTDTGTAQAGTATTLTLKSATSYTSDDACNGLSLHLTGGTGSGQHRHISDYNATTKVATVYPAFTTTPDGTTQYSVKAFGEDSVDEYIVAKNGFGRARITEYVSDTEVKAFVEIPFFDTDATTSGNWELEYGYEDVWSDARGWPQSCVFHEGRLFLGGSKSRPSTVWGSRVADFFNFDPGEQLDDAALEATLDTGRFNAIVDLYSGRNLQVFTTGGEFYIPQTLGDPITPSTLSVKEQTSNGVRPGIPVVNIDGSTLFIQRQGKTLSEFLFSDSVAGYISTRISLLSSHLLKSPSSLAVRKATSTDEGDRVLIVNDDDGSITCFTLLRSEQIVAPSEWTTNGDYVEVGVDIADVYTVVKRTVSSGTKYYVERFVEGLNTDAAQHITSTESPSGFPTPATSGATHLLGNTVNIVNDGVVEASQLYSSGNLTFANTSTSSFEVGLPYTSTVKTLPFEGRLPSGPTRSFKKRILSVTADLYETQALTIDGEAVTFDTNANGVITPYTGFKRKGSLLGYNKDATITITQSEPLDMNILSLDYEVSTGQ